MCRNIKDLKKDIKIFLYTYLLVSVSKKEIFSLQDNADPSVKLSDSTHSKSYLMILSELLENNSIYSDSFNFNHIIHFIFKFSFLNTIYLYNSIIILFIFISIFIQFIKNQIKKLLKMRKSIQTLENLIARLESNLGKNKSISPFS